jgi:hypothetical protein
MVAVSTTPARFDMGRVVGRTFGAVGRNFFLFFTLGLVLAGGPALMMALAGPDIGSSGEPSPVNFDFSLYFGGLVLNFIGAYVLQAALTHGAVNHFNGRPATLGDCVATGLRFFLPVFAIALLASLGMILGLIILIVPGLILATMWAVIVPAEVVERTGVFGAFERSSDLTRDHRWAIFLLGLALAIGSFLIPMVGFAIAGAISATGQLSPTWAVGIAQCVTTPIVQMIGAAGAASLYFELRNIKEGIGAEQLAAVFD